MKTKMPKTIYVYACDRDEDGNPIFAMATNPKDIAEDFAGDCVGEYTLKSTGTLIVEKTMKP